MSHTMPNYWLAVMAVAFASALTVWITLVFRAGRNVPHRQHDSTPHREVVGGAFQAHEGGRQVMPDPSEPLVPEPRSGQVPEHASRERIHR